jgi:hypothetical protein
MIRFKQRIGFIQNPLVMQVCKVIPGLVFRKQDSIDFERRAEYCPRFKGILKTDVFLTSLLSHAW